MNFFNNSVDLLLISQELGNSENLILNAMRKIKNQGNTCEDTLENKQQWKQNTIE